jgi:hypothetical protein
MNEPSNEYKKYTPPSADFGRLLLYIYVYGLVFLDLRNHSRYPALCTL